MSRHALALMDVLRETATDRTGSAVIVRMAMGGGSAAKTVALHHAGKPLALGGGGHIDHVSGGKHVRSELISRFQRFGVHVKIAQPPELSEILHMSGERLVQMF